MMNTQGGGQYVLAVFHPLFLAAYLLNTYGRSERGWVQPLLTIWNRHSSQEKYLLFVVTVASRNDQ